MSAEPGGGFRFETLPTGWTVGLFAALESLRGVRHLVTTRRGPDPHAPLDQVAPDVAGAMAVTGAAWAKQVHGRGVLAVTTPGPAGEGDALITATGSLAVTGLSADCPLILLADRSGRAVGVAHASWRGTVKQIAPRAVAEMSRGFGVAPADLVACICPSAGPCCYEVQSDVLQAAVAGIGPHVEQFFPRRDGKMTFDLWQANTDQLLRAGLAPENIHCAGVCTLCRNDLLPSFRREGPAAGRFLAAIATTRRDERG